MDHPLLGLKLMVLFALLLALGLSGGVVAAGGCDENLRPGTTRGDVCGALGFGRSGSDSSARLLLYMFGPLIVFTALVAFIPPARRHAGAIGAALAAFSVALYGVVLSLVV